MRNVPAYLPVAEPLTFDGERVFRAAIYRVRPFNRIVASTPTETMFVDEADAIAHAAKAITQAMGARRGQ